MLKSCVSGAPNGAEAKASFYEISLPYGTYRATRRFVAKYPPTLVFADALLQFPKLLRQYVDTMASKLSTQRSGALATHGTERWVVAKSKGFRAYGFTVKV